jgi:hypothetical protein
MAKKRIQSVRTPIKKGFKLYPLKKATVIGDELKPVGHEIALSVDGYKFYKQQNIV